MSKDKPSHIPLFVDSYLADTTHLSTEQHGAYLLLMMAAWRQSDCSLPQDEARLAKLAGVSLSKWRKIGPTILEMWICENGRCRQKRLTAEWQYVRQKSVKRKAAANVRWAGSADANALQVECTKGGGGGGGVSNLSHYQEEVIGGGTRAREPLTVIAGGAK